MSKGFLANFGVRWLGSALGLWVATLLLGSERISLGDSWKTVLGAGFFVALVNMLLKPLFVFLSIPALILTLGLFLLVVNAALILIAAWLYGPLWIASFWVAIVVGVIVGLVNLLVTSAMEGFEK